MTIRENQLYRKYILFIWIRLYTTITCETISIFQQSRRNKINNRMLGNNPSNVKSIQFVIVFNNNHQQELSMVNYFRFESNSCMVQWLKWCRNIEKHETKKRRGKIFTISTIQNKYHYFYETKCAVSMKALNFTQIKSCKSIRQHFCW